MKRVGTILFCLALAPSSGLAYKNNILGFDTARPVEPQHLEAGAGVSIGDGHFALYGTGRIGLVPELEGFLRLGGLLIDKDPGAELSLGGKFRAVPAKHMANIADVAVGGELSVAKTDALFVLSLDPKIWISRHFALPGDRELFISLTVGLATTLTDIDGGDDDGSVGFNGAFCTGLDIVKNMAFAVELRARDEARQVGLSVTYDF